MSDSDNISNAVYYGSFANGVGRHLRVETVNPYNPGCCPECAGQFAAFEQHRDAPAVAADRARHCPDTGNAC